MFEERQAVTKLNLNTAIPAYNEEPNISNTVLKANQHVDEIIIVDDSSRDDAAGATQGRS